MLGNRNTQEEIIKMASAIINKQYHFNATTVDKIIDVITKNHTLKKEVKESLMQEAVSKIQKFDRDDPYNSLDLIDDIAENVSLEPKTKIMLINAIEEKIKNLSASEKREIEEIKRDIKSEKTSMNKETVGKHTAQIIKERSNNNEKGDHTR